MPHLHPAVQVRKLARAIACEEGLQHDRVQVIELAALLHDVADWKYNAEKCEVSQAEVVEASDHTIPRPYPQST